jgi:SEC10/PgrA surface exclusion-like protein/LPXTG-motif cell wall-anchored protein
MSKTNTSKILKSVAVLGAVTTAGTIATTTAHADNVATSATSIQTPTSATSTDQQLANLKSQQTANENAVASSNAATMSAASDAANKQIADINKQIASRQASDAAASQAAINSQTNAINSAAAAATSAENASYQNDANNLEAAHTANVNKINSDYQNQESAANQKIADAQSAAAKGQQDALSNATKQVDGQIADANKSVNAAQNDVNQDQNDVSTKTTAVNDATNAASAAQSTLNSDQAALDAAKKAAESGQTTETTDKLNVPQDYINVWKDYKNNSDDWLLTKDKNPDLWERNKEASAKAKEMNKDFVASEQDKNTPIHFNSDGTLSKEDVIIATKYAAELINPVREAIGENPYEITNASIDMTMENASKYRAKGHNDWKDSHDGQLLTDIAHEWGKFQMGESLDGNWSLASEKNLTVADLKAAVHQAVIDLLFEGADGSDNGHTTDLLNVRYQKSQNVHNDLLGVTFDADPVNHNGWVRFNSIQDGKSAQTKKMLDEGYAVPDGTAQDKTIQGSNYDHIAVPTPESQSDAAAKLQKQISALETKVTNDNNAVKLANGTASDAASALKSSQDKLGQDQKKLTDAQTKLNNLKANRDQMIQDLVKDPSGSKLIQDLENQLNAIKTKHADAIKAENADYAAKIQTLKKNHEAKLAAIAAQPENVNDLKAQLQTKLDALKKDHEAKLAAIQNDAKTKIENLKKQAAADDPEITKLQGQIDAIKDNLAKQQKKLDDQFAALKAKDEADYQALEQKLKNSSSEAAKGHNDHYNTSDGHEVVLPGSDSNQPSSSASTPASSASSSANSAASSATTPASSASSDVNSAASSANTPASSATSAADSAANSEAVAPAAPASENQAVAGNITSTAADEAVKVSYPVDNAAQAAVSAPTATTPMTREEVKKQNEAKLPQTGNENGIVAIVLGTMLAMFGLGVVVKKRY